MVMYTLDGTLSGNGNSRCVVGAVNVHGNDVLASMHFYNPCAGKAYADPRMKVIDGKLVEMEGNRMLIKSGKELFDLRGIEFGENFVYSPLKRPVTGHTTYATNVMGGTCA